MVHTRNRCEREELPPRARRIHSYQYPLHYKLGTTSACAENTPHAGGGHRTPGNYLRVRGEYSPPCHASSNSLELPPRARRILGGEAAPGDTVGTTSACAENTLPRDPAILSSRNYLRVRGEYLFEQRGLEPTRELPPRARRILGGEAAPGDTVGTTSACAENTRSFLQALVLYWNYLRVRGEYQLT